VPLRLRWLLIKAGGRTVCAEIGKLINCIWNKEELLSSIRSLSLFLFIRRVIKVAIVIIDA
jgi:hypothetical protein